MPPKAKIKIAKSSSSRKMPLPLPKGEVLSDAIKKQQWILGKSIGKGGFGEIYLAALKGKSASEGDAQYVIKIEPHENGPLFSELAYYRRVAKESAIIAWITKMKLSYLGIPKYITSGSHDYKGLKYRFMVMQRFGDNIQKHFKDAGSKFCEDTISYLALKLLEALQFLHESEYVHGDIKGSNILIGRNRSHEVYLVDYGLAFRFNPDGVHKEYKEDPRKAHDGTIEFTSIDAHKGVSPSRRGDLEILGYCLLQWGCGKLPWENKLDDKQEVAQQKTKYRNDVRGLMTACFGSDGPAFLRTYMTAVYKLGYTDTPNYSKLRKIFMDHLQDRDATKTLEWIKPVQKNKLPAPPAYKNLRKNPSKKPISKAAVSESPEVSDEVSEDSPKEVKKTSTKGVRKVQLKPSPAAKEQVSSSDEESFRPSSPEDKEKIETKPKRQPLQKGLRKRDNDDLLPGGGYNSHNKTRQPQKRNLRSKETKCYAESGSESDEVSSVASWTGKRRKSESDSDWEEESSPKKSKRGMMEDSDSDWERERKQKNSRGAWKRKISNSEASPPKKSSTKRKKR